MSSEEITWRTVYSSHRVWAEPIRHRPFNHGQTNASISKTPLYTVDTCLLPEYIIVGLFSGLFSPFCCFFGSLDFCHFCVHLYIIFTVDNLSGTVNKFHLARKCFCEWAIVFTSLHGLTFFPEVSWWARLHHRVDGFLPQ